MSNTGESLCIHVGQAGVQLGNSVWELFCLEHSIPIDGMVSGYENTILPPETANGIFFRSEMRHFVPRAVMVDLEPTVIDEIRVGSYRKLFHPDFLISGLEDAASNYSRGYFTIGKTYLSIILDAVRRLVGDCDYFRDFLMFHSYGGGTGSGLTSLLLNSLCDDFGKKNKHNYQIYPAPQISNAIVEPYNACLSLQHSIDCCDCGFLLDNEALFDIARRNLDVELPSFNSINRIMSQTISNITIALRFGGEHSIDTSQFQTNLVPYPRIHFPLLAHAPLLSIEKVFHDALTIQDITKACFLPCNQMVKCDPFHGRYMAICLLYRGDVNPKMVNEAVQIIKTKPVIRFVDWCPTGFKIGLHPEPPVVVPGGEIGHVSRNVTMCNNTTSIAEAFARLERKFGLLFAKRAFVHWYVGEGMEEGEFSEASDEITAMMRDYEEVGMDTVGEDDENSQPTNYNQPTKAATRHSMVAKKPDESRKSVASESKIPSYHDESTRRSSSKKSNSYKQISDSADVEEGVNQYDESGNDEEEEETNNVKSDVEGTDNKEKTVSDAEPLGVSMDDREAPGAGSEESDDDSDEEEDEEDEEEEEEEEGK